MITVTRTTVARRKASPSVTWCRHLSRAGIATKPLMKIMAMATGAVIGANMALMVGCRFGPDLKPAGLQSGKDIGYHEP
jgi:hypothetical protein